MIIRGRFRQGGGRGPGPRGVERLSSLEARRRRHTSTSIRGSDLLEPALLTSVFLAALVSGIVPVVNAELVIAAAAVSVPLGDRFLLVVACTVGQMIAKVGLYSCARWLPARLPQRAIKRLDRASEKFKRMERVGWTLVLASAFLGFPPFYVISLLSGAVRMNFVGFVVPGFVGRFARFGVIAYTASAASDALRGSL